MRPAHRLFKDTLLRSGHTLLQPGDLKSYLPRVPGMRSYLCQRYTGHLRTLRTIPRMLIPTLFVRATSRSRTVYDCTAGRHVQLYQGHGPIYGYIHVGSYWTCKSTRIQKRTFNSKIVNAELIVSIIRRKLGLLYF
jgi:hypothetical protein